VGGPEGADGVYVTPNRAGGGGRHQERGDSVYVAPNMCLASRRGSGLWWVARKVATAPCRGWGRWWSQEGGDRVYLPPRLAVPPLVIVVIVDDVAWCGRGQ
jgi:hypothetical protein